MDFNKEEFKANLSARLRRQYGKDISQANKHDLFDADYYLSCRTDKVEFAERLIYASIPIFIAFMAILVSTGWKAWRDATVQRTPYAQLMFSLCFAIGAHMVFEGYAMTAGAIQCVILWMLIGAADQCDKVADYPVAWEKEDPITPEEYVQWRDANYK